MNYAQYALAGVVFLTALALVELFAWLLDTVRGTVGTGVQDAFA